MQSSCHCVCWDIHSWNLTTTCEQAKSVVGSCEEKPTARDSLSALWWKDSGFRFALNSLSRESASWVLTTSYFALKNRSLSSVSPWGLALAFMLGLKDTSMAFPRRPPHSAHLRTHVLCLYLRLCTPFPALCSFIATFG